MSKLEERQSRRRSASVGKFVEQPPMAATSRALSRIYRTELSRLAGSSDASEI